MIGRPPELQDGPATGALITMTMITIIIINWGPQEEMQMVYRGECISLPPLSPWLETNLITN